MVDGGNSNRRDAKLGQWLCGGHAKAAELEANLSAHIVLTQKQAYRKRLQQHLKETRDHKRRIASRIKALGGSATSGPTIPGVPTAVGEAAGKAVATAKGGVGVARAAVTEQAETHMRNAQEELREEHVEIAIYSRVEVLANEVGDRETAQLAKGIRRDEERMAKFLDAELGRLVKDVVRVEIPRDQRATTTRRRSRRRTGRSSSTRTRASARGGAARSRAASSTRSGGSRRTTSSARGRSGSRSTSSGSRSSGSRSSGSRSTRSGSPRSTGSSRRSGGSGGGSSSRGRGR